MTRLLLPQSAITSPQTILTGEFHHKIKQVLRLTPGEPIELIDGEGNIYQGSIGKFDRERTTVNISTHRFVPPPGIKVTLIQAIAKGKRFDLVLQKSTELGVNRIIPLITRRTVARPEGGEGKKAERWREILRHAIEQSGQAWLPHIEEPQFLKDVLSKGPKEEFRILFYEEEKSRRLRDIWPTIPPKEIQILIGPEGGFEKEEVSLASSLGFIPISLGNLILRTDTAPIVALSLVQFLAGQLG